MKKLYRKGTAVHPSPPPPPTVVGDNLLSFLPQAIVILAVTLPAEEKEVLAYLISYSSANFPDKPHKKSAPFSAETGGSRGAATDHPPSFNCYCFRCYMSYWVKWNRSPNQRRIHDIIDAFEDGILKESGKEKGKKAKRRGFKNGKESFSLESAGSKNLPEPVESFTLTETSSSAEPGCSGATAAAAETSAKEVGENIAGKDGVDKGPVRRFVSFLGERIWGRVWG